MARRKLAPVFYGRKQAKYQKICVHNLIAECLMSDMVNAIVMASLPLSTDGTFWALPGSAFIKPYQLDPWIKD